ncbi:tripartite ATP-independent transporter DctP family solute receptor [Rhizobium sp. PP-F2F-G38]|uniref:TRAP transporter substrate-binding protein n=1 Tax=Ferranicluibacter rubi TaxID=2715133 RepID=A0AA44CBN6_9HYPH|nr:TRAP transporter substrate-binding protein [Ferranicluibacter rubi]PYE33935.1 tripartite ATP-independent transporter DctP family solute receptor [Rhizobium sp. PP-WC-1G-195]PYE94458.1 tripartite ATP-independent transporter DctP family solute receptor [Rhizobium sp. PP-F2F-G38]TCP80379.1 tripartite ATP-independent transporter DctP family solute receptor [Rhizobium sp. PP-CC-2G-626]TCQ23741.1 tripartite ATP-independent transporter DctP family solute receptor [Rhizobium sp. PP-CC-3G-465]NHT755
MNIAGKLIMALGIALAASTAQAQEITLRSADIHPDGYPTVEAVKYMGQLLSERSNGRIKIDVSNNAVLGNEKDTIEQTRFGVIDMNRVNAAPFNNLVPETTVLGLPFLFRSTDHMHHTVDGPIGDEVLKAFEPHGLVGLAFYDSGARSFYTTKKPIEKLDDLKGMKIRVQQSDLWIAMMQAFGANPTPMPMGEVYSSLETGVVDGAENNWPSYESARHFEVAKNYTLTEHSLNPEILVISKISWDKLTPEDQTLLRQAAKDSVGKMRELWTAREKASEEKVRAAGNNVIKVDKKPFADAMKPVYDRFVTDPAMKDLLERVQAVQ